MKRLTTFERVKQGRKLDTTEQNKFIKILKKWESNCHYGGKVVPKLLEREHFLSVFGFSGLAREVITACVSCSSDLIKNAYKDACFNQLMKGGEVREIKYTIKYLGRVMALEDFHYNIGQYYGPGAPSSSRLFFNKSMIDDYLNRLMSGGPLTKMEKEVALSGSASWSTWNEKDPSQEPFNDLPASCTSSIIQASLGLRSDNLGKPVLLFIYKRRGVGPLYRPTMADAGLNTRFQPTPLYFWKYGYTDTFNADDLEKDCPSLTEDELPKRQPEAIHSQLFADQIIRVRLYS